jgi:hypothetical protein
MTGHIRPKSTLRVDLGSMRRGWAIARLGGMKPVMRWGGLAGIGGSLLFIAVFALVIGITGPDPAGLAGPIARFPEIQHLRTVENGLYLAVMIAWIPLHLALHQALKADRPATALFGCAISVVGAGILAAGALPHIVTSRLSELYHANEADRDALIVAWQTTQGLFDALLLAGLLTMSFGIALLGAGMTAAMGKVIGGVSVALGLCGLGAGIAMLIDPQSVAAALGVFALIAFHFMAGVKVMRLRRTR